MNDCWVQEEKKAVQDAMIAKIVEEAKRKQAEEDEMRMVRTSIISLLIVY